MSSIRVPSHALCPCLANADASLLPVKATFGALSHELLETTSSDLRTHSHSLCMKSCRPLIWLHSVFNFHQYTTQSRPLITSVPQASGLYQPSHPVYCWEGGWWVFAFSGPAPYMGVGIGGAHGPVKFQQANLTTKLLIELNSDCTNHNVLEHEFNLFSAIWTISIFHWLLFR